MSKPSLPARFSLFFIRCYMTIQAIFAKNWPNMSLKGEFLRFSGLQALNCKQSNPRHEPRASVKRLNHGGTCEQAGGREAEAWKVIDLLSIPEIARRVEVSRS